MSGNARSLDGDRVRIIEERLLSDDWYILKKTTFDYRCRDGHWQRQSRETYDRGNGAVLLLFNVEQETVVLTRQFRFPAYVNGCADGLLIEVHPNPAEAWSDGQQQVDFNLYAKLVQELKPFVQAVGRPL